VLTVMSKPTLMSVGVPRLGRLYIWDRLEMVGEIKSQGSIVTVSID